MACKKYTIKNTSNTLTGVISYSRCSDNLNFYNYDIYPNETVNIWLIDGTYSTAFKNLEIISLINWPPPPPPTPSITPSVTQTPSVTPSVTSSYGSSPTPSVTSTVTPTITPTITPTVTPTRLVYSIDSVSSGLTSLDACSSLSLQTYYTNVTRASWTTGTTIYLDSNFTTPIFATYLSDSGGMSGSTIWETDSFGNIILITLGGCPNPTPSATRTPTPTPTPTETPTPTPTGV